jgi:hypothetical protein
MRIQIERATCVDKDSAARVMFWTDFASPTRRMKWHAPRKGKDWALQYRNCKPLLLDAASARGNQHGTKMDRCMTERISRGINDRACNEIRHHVYTFVSFR